MTLMWKIPSVESLHFPLRQNNSWANEGDSTFLENFFYFLCDPNETLDLFAIW